MFKNKDTLEFIGESDEKYISLKEASEISDYAPDYIGQLIRAGKIEGKQVYSNVAWVTTEDAIRNYVAGKGKSVSKEDQSGLLHGRTPLYLTWFLYGVIALSGMFLVVLLYVLAVTIDRQVADTYTDEALLVAPE